MSELYPRNFSYALVTRFRVIEDVDQLRKGDVLLWSSADGFAPDSGRFTHLQGNCIAVMTEQGMRSILSDVLTTGRVMRLEKLSVFHAACNWVFHVFESFLGGLFR